MGFLTLIFGPKVLAHKNIGSKATPTRKWQKRFSQLYKFWTSYLSISIISCLKLFYVIRQSTLKTLDFFLMALIMDLQHLEDIKITKEIKTVRLSFRNVKKILTFKIVLQKAKLLI